MNTIKTIFILSALLLFSIFVACKTENKTNSNSTPTTVSHEEMEMESKIDRASQEGLKGNTDTAEGRHAQHESLRDNFAHQDIIILENPFQLEKNTKNDLQEVVQAYLLLKDAFVNGDLKKIDDASAEMEQRVAAVGTSILQEYGLAAWDQHSKLYCEKLKELRHIKGLEEKRSYFSHISEVIYCTIKSFDLKDGLELYATFCPMALDGKGAYWISEDKEIRNPYYGDKMLKCGKIEETL
ncbi:MULTISPECIES: DUF3347 domain-containing protein [Arenibacter]|jgi:hypothetical protein|uniref:RND transporter n=1 Tax=Arenibacter algicola TaxID=616991 RepID=A0A221UWN2_9FLAO|nr:MULTISPECIES: DUF3347 domain-containing protein [Arenibacter]ASO05799.1 RND transporter [Arenibacter algicola]MCM4164887.1 DUF3347 domain-containing protein [Arenibacter sp. A80]RFT55302.1 DUF3347 domain-containing protein [Arenibacter sp. P308M17]|tara:strand:- start:3030 stop:3749 length:720 start_codon:yes stop_codon:yes gene_type:complete